MGERRRGRRQSPTSGTVKHKRGALAELRETLTPEQHARLERAVNRKRRGMPPEHPEVPRAVAELEQRQRAALERAAELEQAAAVEFRTARGLELELERLELEQAAAVEQLELEREEDLEELQERAAELEQAAAEARKEVELARAAAELGEDEEAREEQAQGVLNALDGELQARAEAGQDRKPDLEEVRRFVAEGKDLEELAQAVRDEEAERRKLQRERRAKTDRPPERSEEFEAPQCVTLTPDRWCDACQKARATQMCGVCGGPTRLAVQDT